MTPQIKYQSIRTRKVAIKVSKTDKKQPRNSYEEYTCVYVKKTYKESNKRKHKVIRDDFGNGGKSRTYTTEILQAAF